MGYKEILLQKKQSGAVNNNSVDREKAFEEKPSQDISRDIKFYGTENTHGLPTCLDFRLKDGNSVALPYSYIVELDFKPSEGIEVITATKKISIEGRNLQALYSHLVSYRVKYIQANIGNDLWGDKDLFIKTIKIDEL